MRRFVIGTLIFLTACAPAAEYPDSDRYAAIPADAAKQLPADDQYPPILHSGEFEEPIPLPAPVNTAGAEDSAFFPVCDPEYESQTFYVFFTPDVRIPVEKQVIDGVTGIYRAELANGVWSQPERVWLQEPGKLSLDGCLFGTDEKLWFCTAREGLTGLHWFTTERDADEDWGSFQPADFPDEYEVGELHISRDGNTLYFHSSRAGGQGGYDVYVSEWVEGAWEEPVNLVVVNSVENDGWPAMSQDESELWITRWHEGSPALFRSLKVGDSWGEPELMISQFAGEAALDQDGNVYFTHHFYEDGEMIEADIYVAKRK